MTATVRSPDDQLLGHLYDAVMAPSGFQKFIEMLIEVFQLKAVTMIIRHVETQEIKGLWLSGISKEWLESYSLEYAREDMLAQHIMGSPRSFFYASNLDLQNIERIVHTRFYNEWLVPQGVAYAAGTVVMQEGAWLTQMILQRAPFQPPFMREEMDRLNLLVPHLQRALQMRARFAELQLGQSFLAGGLDVLAMPTVLFDEYGRVAHCNHSATALFEEGGSMWLDNGHLQTSDRTTTGKLSLEVGKAIRASRGDGSDLNSVVLLQRDGKLPLMLMIAPLRLSNPAPAPGASLLFAFDPAATPSVTAELVRRLFALSEAEAELAIALCSGKTLDDVAAQRRTSINTIKSQLKNVFLKTGTRRQSELVSLLLASPAYFLAQKH